MISAQQIATRLNIVYSTLAASTENIIIKDAEYPGLHYLKNIVSTLQELYPKDALLYTFENFLQACKLLPQLVLVKEIEPLEYSPIGFYPLLPTDLVVPSQEEICRHLGIKKPAEKKIPFVSDERKPFERKTDSPFERKAEPPFERKAEPPFERKAEPPFERKAEPPFERKTDSPFERKTEPFEPFVSEVGIKKPEEEPTLFPVARPQTQIISQSLEGDLEDGETKQFGSLAMQTDRYKEVIQRIQGTFFNGIYGRCSAIASTYQALYYEKFETRNIPCSDGYHRHPKISAWAECNQEGFVLQEFDGDGDKFFRRTDLKGQVLINRLKTNNLAPLRRSFSRFHMEKLLIGLFTIKTTLSVRVLEQMYESIYEEPMVNPNYAKNSVDLIAKLKSPNVRVKLENKKATVTLVPVLDGSYSVMSDDETYSDAASALPEQAVVASSIQADVEMDVVPVERTSSYIPIHEQMYQLTAENYPLFPYPTGLNFDSIFQFGPFPPRSLQNPQNSKPDLHLLYEKLTQGGDVQTFGMVDLPGSSWVEAHENFRMVPCVNAYLNI